MSFAFESVFAALFGRTRTVAALLLGAALVALAACSEPEDELADRLERGRAFVEKEQYAEAIIEFRGALAIDPNHAGAHWALANAYREAGNPRKAFWELQETVRLDPGNFEARGLYAHTLTLASSSDAHEEALALAQALVDERPTYMLGWMSLGRALTKLGRLEEAKEAFSSAAMLEPGDPEPVRRLADVYRMLGESKQAEELLVQAAEMDSSFASYVNLAVFLSASPERLDDAERAYRQALEHADEDWRIEARGALAGFLFARDRPDEAAAVLQGGLTGEERDEPRLVLALSRLLEAQGRTDEAEQVLRETARKQPGEVAPRITLATFLTKHGDRRGAMEAVDEGLAIDPTHPDARLVKARLLYDEGRVTDAPALVALGRRMLDELIESAAPNVQDALLARGRLALSEGDASEDTLFDLRRAIELGANVGEARYLLGAARFRQRDLLGAREELAQALAAEPGRLEAQVLMTRIQSALGEGDLAIEVGARALARAPGNNPLRLAMVQSLVDLGRLDRAILLLEETAAEHRDAEFHFALGRIHELAQDPTAARASYLAADAAEPGSPAILEALLTLELREGQLEQSARRIEAAVAARPDSAGLARLAGRVAVLQGDPVRARRSLERAIELDPNEMQAYSTLAELLGRQGQSGEALRTFERALANEPEDARLNLTLGMLYETQGRPADAIRRYEVAIRSDPTLSLAKNNLAYLLAESGGDLDRALELARAAKEGLPGEPQVSDTLGWILYKKQLPAPAIVYLREAARAVPPGDPSGGVIRNHLALAYEANEENERAIEVLERALRDLEKGRGGAAAGAPEPSWAVEARATLERLRGA